MMPSSLETIDCTESPVEAALLLARRFSAGDRLVVEAPECDDHAHHVAVEFVHPVVAGARSLPATAISDRRRSAVSPSDCRLVIGHDDAADLTISDRLDDATIMRSYHLLWELVQICLEHPGIVGAAPSDGSDSTGFLYPFLDAAEHDEPALRAALEASARTKSGESGEVRADALRRNRDGIDSVAGAIAAASGQGRRVLTIGNGGSSTDAARLARMLVDLGVDALSLAADYAVLTALANDLGAGHVFTRQLEAFARPADIVVGCSTSGASANLLEAFRFAESHGLIGVGISGYGGGAFAHEPGVSHCLDVDSTSVHRIQEGQAAIITALCNRVEQTRGVS